MVDAGPHRLSARRPRGASNVWWVAALVMSLLGCTPAEVHGPEQPAAQGALDLSRWDFERDGLVALRGQWSVVWGALLDPGSFDAVAAARSEVPVPGKWKGLEGVPLTDPGRGSATYRLRVRLPAHSLPLALRMPEPNVAHRLWANGKLVAEHGAPSDSAHAEQPAVGGYVVSLPAASGALELVVQLSNHLTHTGGLGRAPVLGPQSVISAAHEHSIVWAVCLFGVLLAVAIYHLGIHLLLAQRREAHLMLALSCIAVGSHALLVDTEALSALLGRDPPFWLALKLEYTALYVSMYLGIATLEHLFPEEFASRLITLFKLAALSFAVVCLATPADVYTRTLSAFHLTGLLSMLAVGQRLLKAALAQKPNARFVLLGFVVHLAGTIHDVLLVHADGALTTELRAPSLLVFIASQVWSLAKRYSDSTAAVQRLTHDLLRTNQELSHTNRSIIRFVPHEFLALLQRRSILEVERGDHRALEMNVLFCDIRDFTPLVESMPEGHAFRFINDYLSAMEPPIHRHGGFINQYLGDCIMALFPGRADDAVEAAIDMLTQLEAFNLARPAGHPVRAGIGIHTGPLMLGAIGGKERLDSGVVGDSVNLASRLEGLTKEYGASILISEDTLSLLETPSRFTLRELDHVTPKGKSRRVRIYEVLDALDPRTRALRLSTRDTFLAGVEAYHAERFDAARVAFEQVLDRDPTDTASLSYLERCRSELSGGTSAGATRGMRRSFAG